MQHKCEEIEEISLHKKFKELPCRSNKKLNVLRKDNKENIITDLPQKIKKWEEYMIEQF